MTMMTARRMSSGCICDNRTYCLIPLFTCMDLCKSARCGCACVGKQLNVHVFAINYMEWACSNPLLRHVVLKYNVNMLVSTKIADYICKQAFLLN